MPEPASLADAELALRVSLSAWSPGRGDRYRQGFTPDRSTKGALLGGLDTETSNVLRKAIEEGNNR